MSKYPDKENWLLPVTWEMCGFVKVPKTEAATLEEAIAYFDEHSDDIPLPRKRTYVDASFGLTDNELEFIKLYNEEA